MAAHRAEPASCWGLGAKNEDQTRVPANTGRPYRQPLVWRACWAPLGTPCTPARQTRDASTPTLQVTGSQVAESRLETV